VKYAVERFACEWPEDEMYVVRHHAPREKVITLFVEVLKIFDESICDFRIAQVTFAPIHVQLVVKTQGERLLDLKRSIAVGSRKPPVSWRVIASRSSRRRCRTFSGSES
jgi:hypothetical protein